MNCLGTISVAFDKKNKYLHNHSLYCAVLWKDLKGIENKSISASVTRYSKLSRKKMEKLSETMDLRYLLGILNSRYAEVLLSNIRGGDYHIYPEHLRNLPIPSLTSANQHTAKKIILLVNEILSAKQIGDDTTALERKIDELVYELYGLTEEEIGIVERKNQ
jgi:adenine-specific DNA-methyltransferase